MSFQDLIAMSVEELQQEKSKLLHSQCALRMQRGMGETIQPDQLRKNRRSIARIETALNKKRKDNDN
jgi:ribosomal protein L29